MDISNNNIPDEITNPSMFGEQDFFGNFLRNIPVLNNIDSSYNTFLNVPPILMPVINTFSSNNIPPLTPPSTSPPINILTRNPATFNSISNIMQQSFDEKAKYKQVISPEGLKKIIYKTYKAKEDDEQMCAITRDIFKEGDEIAILPCKHLFNKKAILTWLQKKNAECPVCRSKFDSIEIKEEEKDPPINTHRPMTIIPRYRNIRQLIMNLIDESVQEEEDLQVQQAIIASLRND